MNGTNGPLFALEIPLAWGEQDAFGHLNNVVYFRYFENVRMYYLEHIGVLESHQKEGVGVVLATTTCDFHKPVHWPELLTIRTLCSKLGNTSFTLMYQLTDRQGMIVATGSSVQVMYNYTTGTKTAIPADIRARIQIVDPATFL